MEARRWNVPEGPSLYILKELVADFSGQEIVQAGGNVRAIDPAAWSASASTPSTPGASTS